ncbi:MAG: outer membrane lipoprotein-sorting protein [Pseudomonadota bacterium]
MPHKLVFKAPIVAAIVTMSVAMIADAAKKNLSADQILNRVQTTNNVKNETTELQMQIKERDGSVKDRFLVIKKKIGDKKKALVKIKEPVDLKGVGLLTVSETKDDEAQWLFLPSEKRPRRIASSNKNGKFLDSDLSYEDLSLSTYQNFNNKVVKTIDKDGKKVAVINSVAKTAEGTSYGVIRTWVDLSKFQILKANYYSHKKKLVKKMIFSSYKKFGKVWRAQRVTVQNVKKRRSTTLQLKKVSLDSIDEGE